MQITLNPATAAAADFYDNPAHVHTTPLHSHAHAYHLQQQQQPQSQTHQFGGGLPSEQGALRFSVVQHHHGALSGVGRQVKSELVVPTSGSSGSNAAAGAGTIGVTTSFRAPGPGRDSGLEVNGGGGGGGGRGYGPPSIGHEGMAASLNRKAFAASRTSLKSTDISK